VGRGVSDGSVRAAQLVDLPGNARRAAHGVGGAVVVRTASGAPAHLAVARRGAGDAPVAAHQVRDPARGDARGAGAASVALTEGGGGSGRSGDCVADVVVLVVLCAVRRVRSADCLRRLSEVLRARREHSPRGARPVVRSEVRTADVLAGVSPGAPRLLDDVPAARTAAVRAGPAHDGDRVRRELDPDVHVVGRRERAGAVSGADRAAPRADDRRRRRRAAIGGGTGSRTPSPLRRARHRCGICCRPSPRMSCARRSRC